MDNQPIGIFDSGVGGLSVLQHIHQLLPHENILYVADSGHAPYGCKDESYIEQRSRVITEHLLAQGVKVIVIACNTATASIIEKFRQQYGIPFIGVEPGIKPAIAITKNNNIGVMATSGTLSSDRYNELSQRFSRDVTVYSQSCPGLADQVEAGLLDTPETIHLLEKYLSPLLVRQVDTIVLGCTHYSFLRDQIQLIINDEIQLVDTSRAIAQQLIRVLEKEALLKTSDRGLIHYYTTGAIDKTQTTMRCLLKKDVMVKYLP
ncbi:MAG: glutamate racemase [Gammaproteobacteria bacterium]|nr:glutamate racemase [Gammaproteobacteria bacterium]